MERMLYLKLVHTQAIMIRVSFKVATISKMDLIIIMEEILIVHKDQANKDMEMVEVIMITIMATDIQMYSLIHTLKL